MARKNLNWKELISENKKNNASFGKRTLSFIFDILLINIIIAWPFQRILEKYALEKVSINMVLPAKIYFITMIIFVLAMFYFTFMEYYIGQTPGQMIVNIKSISLNGEMTFWKSLIRNIYILPFFPFYIFWILEPIHLILYKRRLLEKWTDTDTITMEK